MAVKQLLIGVKWPRIGETQYRISLNRISMSESKKVLAKVPHNKTNSDNICIEPTELVFEATKPGNSYELELNIRNKTPHLIKLKIYPPKYDTFCLDYLPQAESLSSGLSKKVKVRYECKDNQDYYDSIRIVSQEKTYQVPVRAFGERTQLKYDTLMEGGIIGLNNKHVFSSTFVNDGPKCRVKIIKDNFENVFITPDEFIMEVGETLPVEMVVIPTSQGTYKHRLLVEVNGTIQSPINVVYSSMEFKFYLTSEEGKRLSELDFGQIYFGDKKVIKVLAVNNTPNPVVVKSKIRLGWKFNESALQSPQELGVECSSTIIQVEPKCCKMEPFSKQPLLLNCHYEVSQEVQSKVSSFAKREQIGPHKFFDPTSPQLLQKYKINTFDSHQTLIAQFGEKKIYCSLKAVCVHPLVKITPTSLTFEESITIKETVSTTLLVRNMRDNLPVKVVFPKAFSFEIIPAGASILPNESQKFEVFLTPVSMGNFKTNISCVVANECAIDIPVSFKAVSKIKKNTSSLHLSSPLNDLNLTDISNLNKTLSKFTEKKLTRSNKSIAVKLGNRKYLANSLSHNEGSEVLALGGKHTNILTDSQEGEEKLIETHRFFSLPKARDQLFVTRKIEKYQPYKTMTNKLRPETREIGASWKKLPKCRKEYTALKKELPVEALKNIEVSEKILNFGKVFVHSKMVKKFEIINNNDFSIHVKLTPRHEFLNESDSQAQIMPAKTRCKFDVILVPKECGEFESLVEYTINSVHCFRFLVQAEVELVTLTISKFNLKMIYQDDASDMNLSDSFELTNEGNTEAHFNIDHNSEIFSISPKRGVLTSGESTLIQVVYKTENSEVMPAGEPKNIKDYNKPSTLVIDERIIVKVRNGVDIFLRVQSNIFEPKCYVKESRLNFGCCIVPKSKTKTFILRNLSRTICLYEIDHLACQNFLEFDAVKGKVLPESSKEVAVTYKSVNIHEINMSFKVIIRGGPIISVPFHAESIAPQISILESSFNFGNICCGNVGSLPIHIRNDSETAVELLLDLLNNHVSGTEYLNVDFDGEKEDHVCMSKSEIQPMVHRIKIEAKSMSKFMLLFQPKVQGYYEFPLPIYIENFIKNDMMAKTVCCFAKKPKFVLEPAVVKFKKKIINDKDNSCFHPLVEFVTLKNPSDNVLKWKIEMPKLEGGKKLCYEIENRRGEVKQKSWQCINIAFNPYESGFYSYTFPVLIFNNEKQEYLQEAEIKVEGEGQYPILLFDRRELILPVVPLQVESVGMFKIINEGYEAIDIKHCIDSMDDLMLIPEIILFYPEGSKMGINKKELYVIVKFVAKKPVSFTVKLKITDGSKFYELPISGTSDNSLFTNFPYLADKENLYKLEATPESVNLRNVDTRNIIDKLHNHYEQVMEVDYNLTCEIIRRWINTLLKDEKVMRFPEDLVNNNDNFLKFLSKLTSKKDLEKFTVDSSQEKFYDSIIRTLKSMGCLLNHIRPYYLLPESEFDALFQDIELKHMASSYKKYYRVMHLECWIILFYQLVSNFWYNPQKLKYTDMKSNVYSATELQVLKWIKSIYSQYNESEDQHKFVDFNRDFRDCFAPIYALYHYNYLNKSQQSLEGLNRRAISPTDYATNIRMLYSMMAKANLIPLISEDEFQYIKEKEMFMLLYQLYESLPQQVPKTAPIIFSCELGERCTKFIEIKNPSNKLVNYWVRMEGSQDYFIEEKEFIRIEPKATYRLAVEFRSRVSQEEVAFLTMFNKKELDNNSGIGCSLVFELRSQIVGRKSMKKLDSLKCPLYENSSVKISVENQFNDKEYGNFKVVIVEEFIENREPSKMFNFYVEIESVKIRRGTSSTIELFYNPMILKPIRCLLIFCDPAVGEFQYEIVGIPEVPRPLQEIKVPNPIYINTLESVDLSLPVYNNFMIKSQSLMEQKWDLLKNTNRLNRSHELTNKIGQDDKEQLKFNVEVNMDPKILQYISIPSELTLFNRKKVKSDLRNRLKMECNFNIIIKDLILDFVLISLDKRDVRRFKAQINVTSQPIVSHLTMKTNARTPLIQEIPIENTTTKDWKITCVVSDLENNEFSLKENQLVLQRDYICKKQCKITCLFVYSPEWISETSCKLTITNQVTNEQIVYLIKGISEEPLSEDHIYFSTFTGNSGLHNIPIQNPYNERLVYRVITDLTEINCSPEVSIEANEKISFSLILSVNSPGIFIGYIKFVDKTGRFFWYSTTIEAEDQVVFEDKIKFETLLDREVEKVLQFKNSLSKTSSYKVDFECDLLQGERAFDIKPYSSYLYRLRFKPSRVANEETNIRIFCPEKGAHIYKVQMISHEHYKRELPALKVEVGRTGFKEIKISELEYSKQNLRTEVSNPNFRLECDDSKTTGETVMKICYKPIQEGSEQCTVKVFCGPNLTKMYEIEGIGIAPFTVESVQFSAIDLKPVLEIIKFKNPYQKLETKKIINQKFSIMIESNEMKVYNFVGYPEQWETEITDILAIPIEFKPKEEGYFESMLTVQADHYKWQYLLKGSSVSQINPFHFDDEVTTKTREQGIKVLRMEIPEFLRQQKLKPNKISVHHANAKLAAMIRPWLKLKIESNDPQEEGKCTVYVRFRPKKPINEIITLSLYSHVQESVKINRKIKLFSEPPKPEETISISINSIRKHIFNIPLSLNTNESLSDCETRLEKGEYLESRVEGDMVCLEFSPSNCTFKNNLFKDLLIVQSAEEYWSFDVQIQLVDIMGSRSKKR